MFTPALYYRSIARRLTESRSAGVALLITLTVITVLATLTLTFNQQSRQALTRTAHFKDRVAAEVLATAAVQAGMALLVRDLQNAITVSGQQDWAQPELRADLLADLGLPDPSLPHARLTMQIEDELGRMQVNALLDKPHGQQFHPARKLLWERFLEIMLAGHDQVPNGYSGLEVPISEAVSMITHSLKDWLDAGDDDAITGLEGAEADYYESLEIPYTCRNGPLPRLTELLLVRGMTPKLFYGHDQVPGLREFLTVHGQQAYEDHYRFSGTVNINTAPLPVLAALLPSGAEALALEMDEYRRARENGTWLHDLSNPAWYRQVPGLAGISLDPELITTVSDTFRITAQASISRVSVQITTVVRMEPSRDTNRLRARVLSWQQD